MELRAGHPGHGDIEDQAAGPIQAFRRSQEFVGRGEGQDLVAKRPQEVRQGLADRLVAGQGDPVRRAIGEASGGPAPETLLRDVTDAIEAAKNDSRIKLIVLDLGNLSPSGLSKLR